MGFTAEIDAETASGKPLEAGSGTGDYPPLIQGKYQMKVIEVIEQQKFGGNGDNANKPVLKVRLQIVDESPNGRRRTFYHRLPLFTKFAPSAKNPQGAANLAFTGFWRDAMGWDEAKLRAGDLPGESDILGKQFTGVLGAPKPPNQWNPLGFNEVEFFEKAGDVNATPTAKPNVPWLDVNGNLVEGYVSPVAGQPAQAQSYTPPPAPGAPAPAYVPPAAPAYVPPTAPAAYVPPAAPGGDPWAPDAGDVSYAQQATPQ